MAQMGARRNRRLPPVPHDVPLFPSFSSTRRPRHKFPAADRAASMVHRFTWLTKYIQLGIGRRTGHPGLDLLEASLGIPMPSSSFQARTGAAH